VKDYLNIRKKILKDKEIYTLVLAEVARDPS
jgi:hypothetical protein